MYKSFIFLHFTMGTSVQCTVQIGWRAFACNPVFFITKLQRFILEAIHAHCNALLALREMKNKLWVHLLTTCCNLYSPTSAWSRVKCSGKLRRFSYLFPWNLFIKFSLQPWHCIKTICSRHYRFWGSSTLQKPFLVQSSRKIFSRTWVRFTAAAAVFLM